MPFDGIGLKQGWGFNLSKVVNPWWSNNNQKSNTSIPVSGYTLTNGQTKSFFYNLDLKKDDIMDGDFCEWNNYDQIERTVSPYYHKMKFNQTVFATTTVPTNNAPGYYYKPHNPMTLRVFSDYVETGGVGFLDQVPNWAFYSSSDEQFRWRDLFSYGFKDNTGLGVDYPFFNTVQRLITSFISIQEVQ
jgi:hypothetical protein